MSVLVDVGENLYLYMFQVDKIKQSEKSKRNELNERYLNMIETQRIYVKTVKDLKEEIQKNEILNSKLRNKQSI